MGLSALAVLATTVCASPSAEAVPAAGVLTLAVKPAPYFQVGTVGEIQDWCGDPQPLVWSQANVTLSFKASAPAGINHYQSDSDIGDEVLSAQPGASWLASNYDGTCGGGASTATEWFITAFDNAGHSVTKMETFSFSLLRWNNANANAVDIPPAIDRWAFSTGWSTSTCACADGGSQTFSTKKGASGFYLSNTTTGEHLGLMMAKGPGRGRAKDYIDGVLKGTVDTYAATNINRVYVWDSGPLTAGQHTVKVVNQATAGRPRIDVNAMGSLQGSVS